MPWFSMPCRLRRWMISCVVLVLPRRSTLIASLVGRHGDTRVILPLVLAAVQEPNSVRDVPRVGGSHCQLLRSLKPALTEEHRRTGEWLLTSQPTRAIDADRNRVFLLVSAHLP